MGKVAFHLSRIVHHTFSTTIQIQLIIFNTNRQASVFLLLLDLNERAQKPTPTQTLPSKTLLNFLTGVGDLTTASSSAPSNQKSSSAKLSGDIPPRKGIPRGEYAYDVNETGDGDKTGERTGDCGSRAGERGLMVRDCLILAEIKLGILFAAVVWTCGSNIGCGVSLR